MFTEQSLSGARNFAHRSGQHRRPQTIEIEEVQGESYLGVSDDGEFDVFEQEIGVVEAELDATGATTGRTRRLANRVKRIMRKRQREQSQWQRRDANLEARQRKVEFEAGMRHRDLPYERQAAGACAPSQREIAKPIATSASIANGASGTLTLTPQYGMTLGRFIMSASASLPAVLVTNIIFGVDPIYGNPEATSGWSADVYAQNATIGEANLRGRYITAQQPLKVTVTNNHTATQTISAYVTADTTLGQYSAQAA